MLFAASFKAQAQREHPKNLSSFDNRVWHFGFTLGLNRANSWITTEADYFLPDSIIGITPGTAPGFNLGIVAQFHVNKNVGIRFLPALSFQDRLINYTIIDSKRRTGLSEVEKRVESTYIDLPVNFKFRTNRINNFAAYVALGGKYSIDLASQQDVNQSLSQDVIVKIKKNDYSAEVGVGFDFFLRYFKFGLELKKSIGIPNVLIKDGTTFDEPLNSFRTSMFLVSFTFEG